MSTLVHEQCHQQQAEQGRPSRSGYHNKEWSQKMLAIGLQPINAKTGLPECGERSRVVIAKPG
jgi:hypothetical protein